MRFSARVEYGILALLELALHNGRGLLQTRIISRNQRISLRFLEQVLSSLRKAGLVKSARGAQGGYILAKPPEEIHMRDVFEAIEGPVPHPTDLSSQGDTEQWQEAGIGIRVIQEVSLEIKTAVMRILSNTTLENLCERKREMEQERVPMYHI